MGARGIQPSSASTSATPMQPLVALVLADAEPRLRHYTSRTPETFAAEKLLNRNRNPKTNPNANLI